MCGAWTAEHNLVEKLSMGGKCFTHPFHRILFLSGGRNNLSLNKIANLILRARINDIDCTMKVVKEY